MRRRDAVLLFAVFGVGMHAQCLVAQTMRPAHPRRIGLLPDLNSEELQWFTAAMEKLGWIEGRHFTLAQSNLKSLSHVAVVNTRMARSPALYNPDEVMQGALRLVDGGPDLILATSTAYAIAAQRVTETIPVVMWTGGYPVEAGVAKSLAHPGKNVTGLSIYAGTGIWGKLIELVREAKPQIRSVGVVWDYVPPAFPVEEMEQCLREFKKAGEILGLRVDVVEAPGAKGVRSVLDALAAVSPDALVVTSGWSPLELRQRVMAFAAERHLPTVVDFRWRSIVDPYPLLVYGAAQRDLMNHAARYVTQILEGEKPGNLPIQRPTHFEFVVNLKTAKAIGLELPQTLLLRADEVVR